MNTTQALLLHTRKHGESGAIATFFTEDMGLFKTYARISKKNRADWQAGNIGQLTWKRRVESQLGNGTWDVSDAMGSRILGHVLSLHTLNYMVEILAQVLPEEQEYQAFYARTVALLATLEFDNLHERLAMWELQLLTTVGYGLALSEGEAVPCAEHSPLMYVSPNTGRAVPALVGAPYAEKLLKLPTLFGGPAAQNDKNLPFHLTGFFLNKALEGKELHARARMLDMLQTAA